jgi:exodeoxyribonuclease VII large subunit
LPQLQQRLTQSLNHRLQLLRQQLSEQAHALNSISPLATLERGYTITTNAANQVIHDCTQLKAGDTIHTRLAQGSVSSTVNGAADSSIQTQLDFDH